MTKLSFAGHLCRQRSPERRTAGLAGHPVRRQVRRLPGPL